MYCKYCGAELHPNAYTCPNCGCRTDNPDFTRPQGKSMIAAGLLAFFLGAFGVHNFYLKRYRSAGVQLGLTAGTIILLLIALPSLIFAAPHLTMTIMMLLVTVCPAVCFGVWIWSIVEAILIFAGKLRDGDGNPLV